MKFFSKKGLLTSSTVIAGILFTIAVNPVYADTVKSNTNSENAATIQPTKASSIKNSSLTKQGYRLRVTDGKIYVGQSNYKRLLKSPAPLKNAKTISPKKVQKIKFRVEKVLNVSGRGAGAPSYLVASKDKKYSGWFTQTSLQYYYLNSKSMSGVAKPLKRIANRLDRNLQKPDNKRDYNQAMKAAEKLKGSQKTFVVNSLKQMKKEGMNKEGTNLLLFGLQ